VENHLNGFQDYSAPRNPKLKLGENEKKAIDSSLPCTKNLDAKPSRDILPPSQTEFDCWAFAVIPDRTFRRRYSERVR
jgi:hypothetical protein